MEGEGKKGGRGRGRGRGRGVRGARGGRGRGRAKTTATGGGRGRPKKMVIESDEEEQIETSEVVDNQVEISDEDDHDDEMVIDERENLNPVSASPEKKKDEPEESSKSAGKSDEPSEKVEFNIDDDISQLVPPTFSTVSKGPPQPMLELTWEHKYTAIGDKLPTPNIHMCIGCKLPIRIYGRLIPCKHVYCHGCATKQSHCSCCSDRVSRIEQAHLGQVFMCNHGGTRYGFDGCRRTYLSQRDLQAHFNHRHKPRNSSDSGRSDSYHGTSSGSNSTGTSGYEHGNSNTPSHYSRQNIPAHYASSGRGGGNLMSASHQSPSNSNARSSQGGESGSSTPGSRYERKSSFTRNPSWSSSYNNRPY